MNVGVTERPLATGQTIAVSAADSGRMISLHIGDRLVLEAPAGGDVQWRLCGAGAVMTREASPAGESTFVLVATQPGRSGVDLVPLRADHGAAPRPIRLIVCVS